MDYYILSRSTNTKVIGKYPQLEKMFEGFNMSRRYEAWGLYSEYRQTPMEKLTGFHVKHHSKITDLISAAQFGADSMLISERFYQLLRNYSCMESVAVPSEVIYHNKSYPFQFIYYPEAYNHFIDFKKSRFYLSGAAVDRLEDIKINSYDDYQKKYLDLEQLNKEAYKQGKVGTYITISELFLDISSINKDFFRIAKLTVLFVVSSRLKEAIEENGITGMQFTPAQGYKRPGTV